MPSELTDGKTSFRIEPAWPGAKTTGRRLAFVRWLTDLDHPLTARAIVNRIWKHPFGRGIVKTPDALGWASARLTHPELLDWLAVDFEHGGWSIKRVHRVMMTSSTYRQSSQVTIAQLQYNLDNRFLSRMPLRRIDAESLRDTLSFIDGRLDDASFGRADPVVSREDGLVTSVASRQGWRRNVYVLQRRSQPIRLFQNFDLPQMSPNCIQKLISTAASQALHL